MSGEEEGIGARGSGGGEVGTSGEGTARVSVAPGGYRHRLGRPGWPRGQLGCGPVGGGFFPFFSVSFSSSFLFYFFSVFFYFCFIKYKSCILNSNTNYTSATKRFNPQII